jgi:nucleotide-binding universal stress UspA family protein
MFAAVERYLKVQLETTQPGGTAAERAANDVRLDQAKRELEKAASAGAADAGIHTILAAVDHAHHPALETACKIAQPLGSRIAVVYVLEPLPTTNLELAYNLTAEYEKSRANALAKVATFGQEVPAALLAGATLREGQAATEILAAAKEFHADLIVIGTHRRGTLARFFMGSTSQAVLRHAPCPVMFVTDPCPTHANTPAPTHA